MDIGWAIIKMIFVLGIILVLLYLLAAVMKRWRIVGPAGSNDSPIRVLSTLSLAPHHQLSLVEMGGEILALGITDAGISLLTKIEKGEAIEKILQQAQTKPAAPLAFSRTWPFPGRPKSPRSGLMRWMHGK